MLPVNADVTSRLNIQDIGLWETSLTRAIDYPQVIPETLAYQQMRGLRIDRVGALDNKGNEIDLLKIFVNLGVRCLGGIAHNPVEEGGEDFEEASSAALIFTLEATFSVDYLMIEELSEEEVAEFAQFNAVHNVWPFWRQHVYDTLKKAALPTPEVPFFAGRL